jgi:hypothetical protein
MAMVQLKCPKTEKSIDIRDVSPRIALLPQAASAGASSIPCPHCGDTPRWTVVDWGRAPQALRDSPDATRLLIDGDHVSAET